VADTRSWLLQQGTAEAASCLSTIVILYSLSFQIVINMYWQWCGRSCYCQLCIDQPQHLNSQYLRRLLLCHQNSSVMFLMFFLSSFSSVFGSLVMLGMFTFFEECCCYLGGVLGSATKLMQVGRPCQSGIEAWGSSGTLYCDNIELFTGCSWLLLSGFT